MSSSLQYLVYTEDMSCLEGQLGYLNLRSVETSAVTFDWILTWFLKMYMTVLYNYLPLYICNSLPSAVLNLFINVALKWVSYQCFLKIKIQIEKWSSFIDPTVMKAVVAFTLFCSSDNLHGWSSSDKCLDVSLCYYYCWYGSLFYDSLNHLFKKKEQYEKKSKMFTVVILLLVIRIIES